MLEDVVETLRRRYGEGWGADAEADRRFSAQAVHVVRELDGIHLMGEPEPAADGEGLTIRCWVDHPVPDLLTADQVAYEVFGLISGEIFFAERRIASGGVQYPFVTGSPEVGHVGMLELAGPHAADFVGRFRRRVAGGDRYQA